MILYVWDGEGQNSQKRTERTILGQYQSMTSFFACADRDKYDAAVRNARFHRKKGRG